MSGYDHWAADSRLGRNSPSNDDEGEPEYEGDVIDEITEVVKRVEERNARG